GADARAAAMIDGQMHLVAHGDAAALDTGMMDMKATERFTGLFHLRQKTVRPANGAGVAGLAAALAIKGRLVGEDGDALAGFRSLHARAILDQCNDLTFAGLAQITDEFGCAFGFRDVEPDFLGGLLPRALPGRAGGRLLRG